jgi:hypothetical protein
MVIIGDADAVTVLFILIVGNLPVSELDMFETDGLPDLANTSGWTTEESPEKVKYDFGGSKYLRLGLGLGIDVRVRVRVRVRIKVEYNIGQDRVRVRVEANGKVTVRGYGKG